MATSPFKQLTLDEDLKKLTLGELLDRAADGPMEIRGDGGQVLAEIHGGWVTWGAAPYPGQDHGGGKTTEQLLESLRAIDRRAAAERAARGTTAKAA